MRTVFTLPARIILACTCVLVVAGCSEKPAPDIKRRNEEIQQLRTLAAERDDYRIFVGVPTSDPTRWATVTAVGDEKITLEDGSSFAFADVNAFVVAYPNGQVVRSVEMGLGLPQELSGLVESKDKIKDVLKISELESGKELLQVTHGSLRPEPDGSQAYTTTLKNISDEKIKVVRFGGYTKTPVGWMLSNVTGQYYSAEEFRTWYGLGDSEWILPGDTVADNNNYGDPPVIWAYFCESESGKKFIAGAVIE